MCAILTESSAMRKNPDRNVKSYVRQPRCLPVCRDRIPFLRLKASGTAVSRRLHFGEHLFERIGLLDLLRSDVDSRAVTSVQQSIAFGKLLEVACRIDCMRGRV